MKRGLFLALFIVAAFMASAQTPKPVTVVDFVHPPLAYIEAETNEPRGAEIAFYSALLKNLGYQPKFVFAPFPRVIEMIKSGTADIGPALIRSAERDEFALFSAEPVLTLTPVLVVLADSPLKQLNAPADLAGFKIGAALGVTVPAFFANAGLLPFDWISGDSFTERHLRMLTRKRFDAFIDLNPLNVMRVAEALGMANDIRLIDIPGGGTSYYVTLSKKSTKAAELLAGINAELAAKKFSLDSFIQAELR
ncbi:substrate-binding periplasmic protein [Desulfogranum marinum]|uniref:substrate-binding periplasmic protein n=1 Tax=Desulfogranum marinum TaxID=453220 RepID=UPI001963E924|nr:transporter substrate-binding domain-containing protein [Desulfogranum marinum]MBM9513956.1 transporter substrate-binding domain-containing protein [Desulfogranum marinum]